ncbi:MAG TPA: hypothetical protein VGR26_09990 [Acidimicrobiales bacterium]|nr:hypothetical protein [Acidimicrobiales bacterium]
MVVLGVAFAVLASGWLSWLAWLEHRRSGELFSPWLLLLVYAMFDVFVPTAIFLVLGPPELASWMGPVRTIPMMVAALVYLVSLGFFAAGYFALAPRSSTEARDRWLALASVQINVQNVYVALAVTGAWYVAHLAKLVGQTGTLDSFVTGKFRMRFQSEPFSTDTIVDLVLHQIAPAMMLGFLALVGVLFFFRHRYQRPVLWGVVLPFVAWLFTLTTFYRGSQVGYFLSLAFLESFRLRLAAARPDAGLARRKADAAAGHHHRGAVALGLIAVAFFSLYGAYRAYNTSSAQGIPISATQAVADQGSEFFRGWGLISLSSIIDFYPDQGHYLGGSSVVDSVLLPVPRVLWEDKPQWYGIDEVTRSMGWITTSQSAVTMPGELYANFGPVGIVLVAGFGLVFSGLHRLRFRPRVFFVYVLWVPHAVLVTQWGASTGLMNSLILLPLALMATWFTVRPHPSPSLPSLEPPAAPATQAAPVLVPAGAGAPPN